MSVTPTPTHAILPYQSPNARALQTAGNAAIGFFAAVGVAAIPILINWLGRGDFSRTAVTTLLSLIGTAILGVLLAYATKYVQARGSDTPPTVSADGTTPLAPSDFIHGDAAIFAPPITPEGLHDILTMATMLQEWQRPVEQPPVAASVPLDAFAPVKRSHHAAKVPTVAPIDVHSDS